MPAKPSTAALPLEEVAEPSWTPAARQARASLSAAQTQLAEAAALAQRDARERTVSTQSSGSMVTTAALAPPTNLRTDDLARATAALPTLRKGEAAFLAMLSPTDQARYATVSATLQNPLEHAALIELLAEGTLASRDSKGGTLLSTLAALTSASSLSPSLSPQTLVRQLTLELAQPSRINQGNSNLCGATAISVLLASTRPAEYARVVAGLASPEGTVELATGTLTRIEGTDDHEPPGRWERSLSQRLLAPALTDFGNGALLGYDNMSDLNTFLGLPLFPGALPSAVSRMLDGVLGLESTSEGSLVMSPDAEALERAVSTVDSVPASPRPPRPAESMKLVTSTP